VTATGKVWQAFVVLSACLATDFAPVFWFYRQSATVNPNGRRLETVASRRWSSIRTGSGNN